MHIAGGSLALLLGPLQFLSGLRRWNMTVHRWAGRLYLTGVGIRRRHVTAHKEWMIRNYVVTYGFVTFRTIQHSGILDGHGLDAMTVNAWLCWAIPLLCAEIVLQWQRTVALAATR